jgi:V-type H+-transporting ATPase subunit D
MSSGGTRLNVFPTRQNLQVMKIKLVGAKKGHSLLKKKADALTMRLRGELRTASVTRAPSAGCLL